MNKSASKPVVARLGLAVTLVAVGAAGLGVRGALSAESASFPASTPTAHCGHGDLPETIQGRAPKADYASGRAAKGYRCNAALVGHQGSTGGFKVGHYTDTHGHACAYYDAAKTYPVNALEQSSTDIGVIVLDMDDPAKPIVTTTLVTPTMLSPHESLLINVRRGLMAAVMGNGATAPGIMEVYSLKDDCRHPRLLSRTDEAVLGHESGWSLDGKTFYADSSGGQTFVAIDLTDPSHPKQLFRQNGVNYHGMRLSDDGKTLFVADIGNDLSAATLPEAGLRILDVSQIQERKPDPQVHVLSNLTWREGSIPQVPQPFESHGHQYLLEVDEFSRYGINGGSAQPDAAPVGAARIIDVDDLRHPYVVSDLRLAVQQPTERIAANGDPGAVNPLGGYTAHYCSVPYRNDPRIAACSMIGSGLRVFDISDVEHPTEVAYYNKPTPSGSAAFSCPAWDLPHRSIWYTDANSGFYVVRLTHGVGALMDHLTPTSAVGAVRP